MSNLPTPHLDKLTKTLENEKLPRGEKARIKEAIRRYESWVAALGRASGEPDGQLARMVGLLNEYKTYVEIDLIFDSTNDFLYRQKGQLKLDNSILEEFLPRLICPAIIPEIEDLDVLAGPAACFSSVYFSSSLDSLRQAGGLKIRSKNQDFAISKRLYLKASHDKGFEAGESVVETTHLGYVVAECKTNLDKTMFQEACATAHDVKSAIPGARYFLLCEWLDMTPLSTAPTDVDEVLILRKAKRIGASERQHYSTAAGRKARRRHYLRYLDQHPLRPEVFQRFIDHVRRLVRSDSPAEADVLELGYF